MPRHIAQATQAPSSGASNAEDFHPPTQNPQDGSANIQQQNGNLQNPISSDILKDQNLQIVVPSSGTRTLPATYEKQTEASELNLGWALAIIILVFVATLFAVLMLKQKHKKGSNSPETFLPPEPETSQPKAAQAPTKKTKKHPKKQSKKNKQKRKRK